MASVLVRIAAKQALGHPLRTLIISQYNGKPRFPILIAGFTLVEAMIVCALVGLLGAIAIPSYLRSRDAAHRSICINNLKQIDSAIQQWSTEHQQPQSAIVEFSDIRPYLKGSVVCPSGGTTFSDSYTISTVADLPRCQKEPRTHVWLAPAVGMAGIGH